MPLFPLPNVSLIPFTVLRLHVFEPRYVQLVRDAMAGNRLMAIPKLSKGWESEKATPKVDPIAGIGVVAQLQELKDDRYLIVLIGVGRLLILGEHRQQELYRRAYGELLNEPEEETVRFEEMKELFIQLLMSSPQLSKELQPLLGDGIKPLHMVNAIGHILLQDPNVRNEFLCSNEISARCELLIAEITSLLLQKGGGFEA